MVWHRVALFQARALLKNERSHRRNADCRHDGVPPPVLRVGKKAACWAPDLYGTGHHAGKVSGAVEEEQKKPNGQGVVGWSTAALPHSSPCRAWTGAVGAPSAPTGDQQSYEPLGACKSPPIAICPVLAGKCLGKKSQSCSPQAPDRVCTSRALVGVVVIESVPLRRAKSIGMCVGLRTRHRNIFL